MIKNIFGMVSIIVLIAVLSGCKDQPKPNQEKDHMVNKAVEAVLVQEDLEYIRLTDAIWNTSVVNLVTLYPQTTIKVNDRNANLLNKNPKAKNIKVRVLVDGDYVAMKICWGDETKSIQSGTKTDEYPDGFALQIPQNFSNLNTLPYIGMGSPGRPVLVYLRKAVASHYEPDAYGDVQSQINEHNYNAFDSELGNYLEKFRMDSKTGFIKKYERVFISQGFRSMTQIKDGSAKFRTQLQYNEEKKEWEGLIVRPLNDAYTKLYTDTFPVAFGVWDGAKLNRDGLKLISSWIPVKIQGSKGSNQIEYLIGKLNANLSEADIEHGEKLTKMHCANCHRFAQMQDAPEYMAPNLANIGGYSTTEYLKESIINPNAVVVSGYNRNAHPNYKWYYEDDQEGRISAMPAFDYLRPDEVRDIVAYLKTLKAQVQ
ncbi:MAG: c-type cytochrome [Campylobacterales bacterium]|nr:c-type cytochrome [Campylobacterales bacterium]